VNQDSTSRASQVYFIEAVGLNLVKIGFARDIGERMRKLRPGCPAPLRLLGTVPGGATKERDFHVELHRLQVHGEWFRRGPALDAILATIDPPGPLAPRPMKRSRRLLLESTETAAEIAARL
jgi:hypothetical protein